MEEKKKEKNQQKNILLNKELKENFIIKDI
jgi:hypothetical protein